MNRRRLIAVLAFCLAAAGVAAQAPESQPRETLVQVLVENQPITIRICRPNAAVPAPLVVINHGSPAKPEQRPTMTPTACNHEVTTWFLRRGYIVAFPLRRGYGTNAGAWAEEYGRCGDPDFTRGGLTTAADIDAAVRHLHTLPLVRTQGTIVVGQSAGGWGTIAYASTVPASVAAFINFAGGRGGWAQGRANTNCAPHALIRSAGTYGRTARAPMLWIYAENDTFFSPDISKAMYDAFVAAGGKAEFRLLPAFGSDGHGLFNGRGGSQIWGGVVEPFLAAHRFAN